MKKYKILSIFLAVLLAVTLVTSLVKSKQQEEMIQYQHEIIRLNTAYTFMRDVYLKSDAENRPYPMLVTFSEFLCFEDENYQAVVELIRAVQSQFTPQSPYLDELSPKIDELVVYVDHRGGTYHLTVDVDAVNALVEEIYNQPIS